MRHSRLAFLSLIALPAAAFGAPPPQPNGWIIKQSSTIVMHTEAALDASMGVAPPKTPDTTIRSKDIYSISDRFLRLDRSANGGRVRKLSLVYDGKTSLLCIDAKDPRTRALFKVPNGKRGVCERREGYAVADRLMGFDAAGLTIQMTAFSAAPKGKPQTAAGENCTPFATETGVSATFAGTAAMKGVAGQLAGKGTGNTCVGEAVAMRKLIPGERKISAIQPGGGAEPAMQKYLEYARRGLELTKQETLDLTGDMGPMKMKTKITTEIKTDDIRRASVPPSVFRLPRGFAMAKIFP